MTGFLFENFDKIAESPGGVQRLRELILQLAVTGRLGTGDERDEPALRDNMVISDEERKPYWIPKNWILSTLEEISEIVMGNSPPGTSYNTQREGVPLINGPVEFTPGPFGTTIVSQYTTEPTKMCKRGDLLICVRGSTTGRTNVAGNDACIGRGVALIRAKQNQQFVNLFVYSNQKRFYDKGTGSTFPSISQKDITKFPIYLPPLAEQQRIVDKVDCLMALCDDLEVKQTQKHTHLVRLGTGSLTALQQSDTPGGLVQWWEHLQTNFGLIFDCVENVEALRQTILQLAVTGRLGTGDEKDEPAQEILARINGIKKPLKMKGTKGSLGSTEEQKTIPFKVPMTWIWVSLGEIAEIIEYGSSTKAHSDNHCIPILRMNNLIKGTIDYSNLKYVDPDIDDLPKLFLHTGDILFNRTNSFELVGKTSIFKENSNIFTFASYLIRIRLFSEISPDYVNFVMNSTYFRESQIKPQIVQQCGQANFNGSKLRETFIPLPPLAEQRRIIKKVNHLMTLCDELERNISHRSKNSVSLSNATIQRITGLN